jgi:hypothetical protein
MPLFDSPEKIQAFVHAVSEMTDRQMIRDTLNSVAISYTSLLDTDDIRADNYNLPMAMVTFGLHPLWRELKMQHRKSYLLSHKILDPNKSPQEMLLTIVEGPGGTERCSFKWLFLKELAHNVYLKNQNTRSLPAYFSPPSEWNVEFCNEHSQENLTDAKTAAVINEIIRTLKNPSGNISLQTLRKTNK